VSVRLEELCRSSRAAVERRRQSVPLSELERAVEQQPEPRPFSEALSRPGTSLIAEYKRRSPSAGVRCYERGGAAALSILTEEEHFGGSLDDLRTGRNACDLPVLRKDFTVDPYQVYEARAAGADAVLLVVGALERRELGALYGVARGLDLDVLVEVHDEPELEAALEIDAAVIGVNNRDLEDFSVDLGRTFDLLADVPAGKIVVSESGIERREQIEELEQVGVDAVLVGETLMRAPDPEAAVRDLTRTEEPTQA
jgi:indole-3-glycerol phosphate synthase